MTTRPASPPSDGLPPTAPASAEDTSGVHVWLVLWKAYAALARHAHRHVAALDLVPSEFGALEVLLSKGPQPVNVIGPMVALTPGSISVAVDRLVRKGLVRRRGEPGDRRVRLVELTAKGRETIVPGLRSHRAAMEAAAAGVSTAERATLVRLLKKYGQAAQAIPPAQPRVGVKRSRAAPRRAHQGPDV